MPIIPLTCPNCGGNLTVDSSLEAAVCSHCKKPYIVKDAVFQNYITNITNITADTVNVYSEKDFEIKGGKLIKYNGESDHVVIPSSAKIIGGKAFANMPIVDVVIPDTVLEIEANAFAGCKYLKQITIPESVKTFGGSIFSACSSLEAAVLCKGIEAVAPYLFSGCKMLKKVSIPEGIRIIEDSAFSGCSSLTEITIPASVASIELFAFADCSALEKVTYSGKMPVFASKDRFQTPVGEDPDLHHFKIVFRGTPYLTNALERMSQRRRKRVCQYCGGSFEGMFSKVCSSCGKPKDY